MVNSMAGYPAQTPIVTRVTVTIVTDVSRWVLEISQGI